MRHLRYVEHLAIQQAYNLRQREFQPPFSAMFGLALSVHVLMLLAWSLMPGTTPFNVPLQALNVRLGGAEDAEGSGLPKASKDTAQKAPVKTPVTLPPRPVQEATPRVTATQPPPKTPPQPRRSGPPPTVSPSARGASGLSPTAGRGVAYGNATVGKQVMERYTRQISLQVQAQTKAVHRSEDMKRLAQGKQIAVELLLVINSNGMLDRYQVARSSGFAELDQAAIGAAYRAAPFPPPPAEYSGYGFKVAVFVD